MSDRALAHPAGRGVPARQTVAGTAALSVERLFLIVRVSGRRYAMPAETVSEIIPVPRVARLPHSPPSLLGLANLRGAVIPVVSLAAILGLKAAAPNRFARAVVLNGAAPVALVVDAVETLQPVATGRIEISQADLAAEPGELLLGAFRIAANEDIAKILDVPALLATAFGAASGAARKPRAVVPAAIAARSEAARVNVEYRLLITFDVAGQAYALPLEAVREIIPLPRMIAAAPRAEAVLLGITAWRETLLPLLSLRVLLGFPPADAGTGREKVIVATVNRALVGLVADRMRALVRADTASIDPAPGMLAARSGGEAKIVAIYRADGGRRLISLLAPEQLFREDVMRQIENTVTAAAAPSSGAAQTATAQFVVFRLGGEEFGLPIAAVDEVARVPKQIARVPKMPDFLEGVINLRGEVLPVVDQRRRFDMPKFSGTGQRLIVVRAERHRAGLIVDGVSDVLRAPSDAIEPPPDLTGEGARLVNGVINIDDGGRMVLLLDPTELLTRAERGVLDKLGLDGAPDGL